MKQILDKVNEIAEVLNDTNGVTNVEWVKNNVNELQDIVKEICNLPFVSGCATLEAIEQAADKLTDDERMELIGRYCKYCGNLDNTCQCWNDE